MILCLRALLLLHFPVVLGVHGSAAPIFVCQNYTQIQNLGKIVRLVVCSCFKVFLILLLVLVMVGWMKRQLDFVLCVSAY